MTFMELLLITQGLSLQLSYIKHILYKRTLSHLKFASPAYFWTVDTQKGPEPSHLGPFCWEFTERVTLH